VTLRERNAGNRCNQHQGNDIYSEHYDPPMLYPK
jgi:hypothetical protein